MKNLKTMICAKMKHKAGSGPSRRAFTLIKLLVVIAIIAILAVGAHIYALVSADLVLQAPMSGSQFVQNCLNPPEASAARQAGLMVT